MLRRVKSALRCLSWVLLFVLALSACSRPPGSSPGSPDRKPARSVETAQAETRSLERTITVTGTLAAMERSPLSIKVPGRLRWLKVDLGSVVRQGEEIAQVEPRDYELRLQQAAAALAQARASLGLPLDGTNLVESVADVSIVRQARAVLEEAQTSRERVVSLARSQIASQAELDTMEAGFIVASNRYVAALDEARIRQATLAQRQAELDLARQQLSDTTLKAPFHGTIESRMANVGEYLTPASPVITLVRTDPLRLRLEIPERDAARLRSGEQIRFQIEGDARRFETRIARLSPSISDLNRVLVVEADVTGEQGLRPGAFVRADIVLQPEEPGTVIPARALVIFAGIEKVVLADKGQARERTVTTGRRGSNWVETLSGVSPGDHVVLDPGNLRTGDPLDLRPPATTPGSGTPPVAR